jgi:hypothetical protein
VQGSGQSFPNPVREELPRRREITSSK